MYVRGLTATFGDGRVKESEGHTHTHTQQRARSDASGAQRFGAEEWFLSALSQKGSAMLKDGRIGKLSSEGCPPVG